MKFEIRFTSCLLFAATEAGPIPTKPSTQKPRTNVDQSLYDELIYYGKYAPTYPNAPCQIPPQGTVVQGFANADPTTEMTLFRADGDQELVMAFPGTAGLEGLLTDISATLVPYVTPGVNCSACQVHMGGLKAWNAIQPEAKRVLDQAIAAYPSYKFKIVGHRLGGMLTKLAYTSFAAQGI
ncbi:putative feruloyl esterase A [Fulvia fulva]|nr:putative feruloyl esterase A [Fulvia fulva]